MPTPFKVELIHGGVNDGFVPVNNLDCWLDQQAFPLQTDPEFQVFFLKERNFFANKVYQALQDHSVVSWQESAFLSQQARNDNWPHKTGRVVESNPQGTQILHQDNSEIKDPRRWNLFANLGPRQAKTLVIARELFQSYERDFMRIFKEVRGLSKDVLLEEIDTYTPINSGWYERFRNDEITPDNPLSLYWLLEITTKLYRRQNFLKKELDSLYAQMIKKHPEQVHVQSWQDPAVLIHDNFSTLHGRYCPDTDEVPTEELKRVIRLWIGQMIRDEKGVKHFLPNEISELMAQDLEKPKRSLQLVD